MSVLRRLLGGGDVSRARARRPQALAATLHRPAHEGLDWLRREPSAHAPLLYRLLLAVGDLILYRICRIQVLVTGREHLPAGGYIAAVALHRGWIDPLVVIRALPMEPRVWFMGSAATAFDRRWKEVLLRRTGGLLPVWRGGGVEVHVQAARAVADQNAVLCLFIEGAIVGPAERVWPGARGGTGLIALRSGMPIVPVALIGGGELYRGRRIAVRILPATSAAELVGEPPLGATPLPNTRAEIRMARLVTKRLAERIDAVLPELARSIADSPSRPRHWRWLTGLMR